MSKHVCQPTKLDNEVVFPARPGPPPGQRKAHNVPPGSTVTCHCGKVWRVTQNHLPNGGCGCGWALVDG